ncbi:zinc finger BED domain-containing protein RICESLEEPER 1-like [Curcuma longa]|uniref:zinc finger BED domain-containing protein RICESLEEPER 1-like n=1 Tax=Curcuma longa TaxID=136217 RepID=UPI003D9DE341
MLRWPNRDFHPYKTPNFAASPLLALIASPSPPSPPLPLPPLALIASPSPSACPLLCVGTVAASPAQRRHRRRLSSFRSRHQGFQELNFQMEVEENISAIKESNQETPPAPKPLKWKPNMSRKRKKKIVAVQSKSLPENVVESENQKVDRRFSWVWEHFVKFKEGAETRARCKHCGKDYAADGKQHGTSNLITHLKKNCTKYRLLDPNQKTIGFQPTKNGGFTLTSSSFSQEECRLLLAKMVIRDEHPFRVVEGAGFKEFVHGLQPRFNIPSRFTVARDCMKLYEDERRKLKKSLSSERVNLTTDTWTSLQNVNYMCVTAHWIDKEWNLQKRIVSFCVISDHKAKTICKMLESCLLEWGIEKLLAITMDNAATNGAAMKHLRKKMTSWKFSVLSNEFLHLRCSAHSLNLVVKSGLKQYSDSIKKIRNAVRYIRSSPSRFQSFKKCASIEKIECKRHPCLDVETRWNSTYLMLESTLEFEKAFERLREDDSNYQKYFKEKGEMDEDDELDDCIAETVENEDDETHVTERKDKHVGPPIEKNWEIARYFMKFLKVFYNITIRFSSSSSITANIFFQEIVGMHTILKAYSKHVDASLAAVAIEMQIMFAKYWQKLENMNPLMYVATVLDPRYKMKFIRYCFDQMYNAENQKSLPEKMENEVKAVVSRLYDCYMQQQGSSSSTTSSNQNSCSPMNIDLDQIATTGSSLAFEFAKEIEKNHSCENKSELTKYLEEPCEKDAASFDILQWWKNHSVIYPVLSQLARDVLAIPVSSVASESAFSTSGRVIDTFRSSLSPEMVEALICCQNWLRMPSIIDVQELMMGISMEDVKQYEEIVDGKL